MKSMLITGATSGIGSFLSQYYSNKGFKLFLHGRDSEKLSILAKKLGKSDVTLLKADFTSKNDISDMFKIIVNKTNNIDVLINNAFGKLESKITETEITEISNFFQVSLTGTSEVIRQSIPLLKKSNGSNIINIVADWGFPMHNIMTGPSIYIAAKYGIHGLGVALQSEIADLNIKTTNIFPGIVSADSAFNLENSYNDEYDIKSIHPIDLAKSVDFILNQKFSNIRSIVLSPNNPDYNGL